MPSTQRTLHLFGAGWNLVGAARIALSEGWEVCIRTSTRLSQFFEDADEEITGLGFPIFVADSLTDAMKIGNPALEGDVALSFGAPWLFPAKWIEQWNGRAFNIHSRRLPEHRGAGDSSWLLMMKERRGRACIHELSVDVDAGPVVASQDFTYETPYTVASYREQERLHTAELLSRGLPEILKGNVSTVPQDADFSSYWPRLNSDVHGWIDWSWTANDIDTFVQAFAPPLPGSSTYLRNERVRIQSSQLVSEAAFHPFQSGLIFRIADSGIFVAAQGGILRFNLDSQMAPIARVGDRFFTPVAVLEQAKGSRVQIGPDGTWASKWHGPTAG